MKNWILTITVLVSAIAISIFLWSIGIYFFFLPIVFLPFLRFVKFKPHKEKASACPVCRLCSDGNFCPRCGAEL